MAMNKQRRTSNINNIVTYDTLKNVTVPASLTVKGITQAGFVKSDGNGLFSVDTTAYQAALPSQTGQGGKFLTTDGSALSWSTVSASNIYNANGTILSDRTVTLGSNILYLGAPGASTGQVLIHGVNSSSYAFAVYSSNVLRFGVIGYGGVTTNNHSLDVGTGYVSAKQIKVNSTTALAAIDVLTASGIDPVLIKSSSGVTVFQLKDSGNLILGSTADTSLYKLDVQGAGRFTNNVTITPVNGGTIRLGLSNAMMQLTDNGGYSRFLVYQSGISNSSTTIGGGNLASADIRLDSTGVFFGYPSNQNTSETWKFSRPFAGAAGDRTLLTLTTVNNNAFTTTYSLTGIYINPDPQYWARVIALQNTVGDVLLNTTSGSTIIGATSINASSKFQIDSTTKGFLPPRMTSAQRVAISTPATGLVVYQTDSTEGLYQYKSTGWEGIGGSVSGVTSFNTRTGAITLTSSDVTTALGFTPISTDTNIFNTSGTLTGHRVIYGGGWTFTIQDINSLTVDSTSVTNNVASFKATEPNVVIQAMGASNGAALFLNPSNSGINGSIHNRTGGGLEFYVGSTPTLKQTIKATGQIQFNGYTSTGSFSGTAAGYLGFDSSGNIITTTGVGGITLTTTGSSGAATWDGTTLNIPIYSGGGGGSVTTLSVVSANGFAGTVANATSTPAITLTTTISGILKGNSTSISAATAGLDYQAPITLTTTGSTSNATFSGNTLNVPNYALSNLYNANGTLAGNRTITSGGFTLAIGPRVSIGTTTAPSSIFDLAVNGLTDTGGLSIRGTTFTANATATLDRGLYVYGGTGTATLTLLDSLNHNSVLFIKNNSASVLTIAAAASRFIQLKNGTNVSTQALASNDTIILISNGLNHYVQI